MLSSSSECLVRVWVFYLLTPVLLTSAKSHIMCQTSVNMMPGCIKYTSKSSGTEVPRLDTCWSIISLSKIAHQMWWYHPVSRGGGDWRWQGRGEGAWTKFEKEGGGLSNIGVGLGVFIKQGKLRSLCQLRWYVEYCNFK